MKDKPFALIGVNGWQHDPNELKQVMVKENLNWRSFAGQGAINRQWNSPATPAFYVIDHEGTIRRKWVGSPGEKSLDAALAKLIQEAEETAPPK